MIRKWILNIDIRSLVLWVFVGCSLTLPAQDKTGNLFISPFDFPLFLSGNFGELRSNHFHGGLDFKTQGVVGKPIRCIADGYIGRVTVTPGGYGQAVYIMHDNGYTSVYGHLWKFTPPCCWSRWWSRWMRRILSLAIATGCRCSTALPSAVWMWMISRSHWGIG